MTLVLTIAAVVLFVIAAIFVFVETTALAPLGLIAVGLACLAGAQLRIT